MARCRPEALDAAFLAAEGLPRAYDIVVCVGNVMVLLAPGSERTVLARLGDLVVPDGRLLVGFSLVGGPPRSRVYPADEFAADAAAAGPVVESRYASFDLRPLEPGASDFAVHVLRRASAVLRLAIVNLTG